MRDHDVSTAGHGQVWCRCGEKFAPGTTRGMELAIEEYARHYALEVQAAKPRARRGGVDESAPTSRSHMATLAAVNGKWSEAGTVYLRHLEQAAGTVVAAGYTPQRIRTCLAGLVRAGIVEERKVGKRREYRMALKLMSMSMTMMDEQGESA